MDINTDHRSMKPLKMDLRVYHLWFISGIVLLAFLLRVVNLGTNPAGFFRDEADKGYTTFTLIENGTDQTGEPWPLFVRALHVTTSAVYQYVDIPFIAAWGFNEWAVRLPAAIAGTLSVLVVYLLSRLWWGKEAALWTALFVCFSPWSLVLSRWANQSILLTLWIPLGVYFLVREKESPPSWPESALASFFFLLALYTYAPARLFVPVFAAAVWVGLMDRKACSPANWKGFVGSLLLFWSLFLVGMIPLAHHVFYETAESSARLSSITIFDGQPWLSALNEWIKNYFLHFSPQFLFSQGDENLRHSSAFFGQLHWYLVPLVVIGIVRCCTKWTRLDRVLLAWLVLFPIAAACTRESIPHALRSVFAIPMFQLMAGRGIHALFEERVQIENRINAERYRMIRWVYCGIIFLTAWLCVYDLHVLYPRYSAPHWEYGYREAIRWWEKNREPEGKTVVTGIAEYPYIFFLFYTQYPPQQWIEEQQVEGVTFAARGESAESAIAHTNESRLLLVRPQEMQNLVPEKVIMGPDKISYWKWVSWGKRSSEN